MAKDYLKLVEKNKFKTGDILLFSNNSKSIFTSCIKICTRSKYTHAAMIIKNPKWNKSLRGYYVLQSCYDNQLDVEDNEKKFGVELVKLEELIDTYTGSIYWRHVDTNRNSEFFDKLEKAHSVVHNRPYDVNIIDWIKAAFNLDIGNNRHLKRFWCSALVSYMLVQLGLLAENTNWSLISPMQLGYKYDKLHFTSCEIYNEIRIK
jgi:hypothetical protein